MPVIKSAKKALRGSERKRIFNLRKKRTMKDAVNTVVKLVSIKKTKEANEELSKAYKAIDKAVKRGILKKNTAARKKSTLSRSIKNISK
ncbi:MAG: 30S ribosomal protein S20 [Candidatus Pacebacteria bacterium]|nr:30S ribosomal protein S20 [Candidatus Paceibacterota bacterium]